MSMITVLTDLPAYPLNYVKVLMQLGHEPLLPFKSKTILGNERQLFPNSLKYIQHVHSLDGFSGLYRGLGMKILANTVGTIVYRQIANLVDENEEQLDKEMKDNQTETNFDFFYKKTSKEINLRCYAVVFSHPFHVMALRCMTQFISGETNYSSWNLVQNTLEIYRGEGISGFFNGLIPRIIFEASTIVVANGLAYVLRTHVLEDEEFVKYIDMFSAFIAHTVTYPLSVVSTVSSVSGSTLAATKSPLMPVYTSWLGVFKHLYDTNGFRRGSSHFFRVALPAVTYTSDLVF